VESVPKIQLLISLRKSVHAGTLINLLEDEIATLRKSFPRIEHRLAVRLSGDPTASVPQDGAGIRDAIPPSFDVWLELAPKECSIESLIESLEDLGDRLGSQIDRSQSAIIIGQEHTIVPGTESLLLIMAIRRRSHLSSQQFHDFWRNDHASDKMLFQISKDTVSFMLISKLPKWHQKSPVWRLVIWRVLPKAIIPVWISS
jgi:hypothetical protein